MWPLRQPVPPQQEASFRSLSAYQIACFQRIGPNPGRRRQAARSLGPDQHDSNCFDWYNRRSGHLPSGACGSRSGNKDGGSCSSTTYRRSAHKRRTKQRSARFQHGGVSPAFQSLHPATGLRPHGATHQGRTGGEPQGGGWRGLHRQIGLTHKASIQGADRSLPAAYRIASGAGPAWK